MEIGACGCGISDHGVVSGHLEFYKEAIKHDIKPILGIELYHGLKTVPDRQYDQAHLIAFAHSPEGLRNLWRLINQTGRNDHYHHVGRVFNEDIAKYKEGIIFTSACALGLVPRQIIRGDYTMLNWYLDTLGDNFWIELSTYPGDAIFKDKETQEFVTCQDYNLALAAIAQERGLRVVYGDDSHYAFPEDFPYHDAYIARQTGQSIFTPIEERTMHHPENAVVMKDADMIYQNLSYLPREVVDEALANANELIASADVQLPETRRHLPPYVPSQSPWVTEQQKKLSAEDLFIELVVDGIYERYGDNPSEEVWARVAYEIEVLIRDGIHHYFLMGWDEMKIADHLNIERGPGRGSSGSAIVAYALGITDVCPLHYGLIFERFWNSGRVDGFPDIDSDFSRARRGEMIEALKKRWGEDRVLAIGTTTYLKPKSVIDKLAGACGITLEEAEELKEIVGRTTKIEILGHDQIGWSRQFEPDKLYYVSDDVGDDIKEWIKEGGQYRAPIREYFVSMCEATCSRVAQYGIHASGLIVADVPTADWLPAQVRGGKNGVPASMFTMTDVDKLQFVKLDVLGLRTLDVLAYWKQQMKEDHGIDIVWSGLDREEPPEGMWQMVHDGFTAGIFQIEDGYGRSLCRKMKPHSIMDLAVIGALNRPGPIQAGIPDEYIARRNGLVEVSYPHPRFEEMMGKHLESTFGLIVFQEQVINFFNELGYTLGESDAIRKIMGKKKPEQLDAVRDGLGEWKGRGYLDMAEKAGIPRDIAANIWSDLEGFADYSFNLSHSVEYGVITFRTMYAKYYGTAEFYAAVISSMVPNPEDEANKKQSADNDKRKQMLPIIINECRRLGIGVEPPRIEFSKGITYAKDETVYFGFSEIKGVRVSGPYIAELRDEHRLDVSSEQAFRDAFDSFNEAWAKKKKLAIKEGDGDMYVGARSPKQRLGSNKIDALAAVGAWRGIEGPKWSLTEQQTREEELLGCVITDNSMEILELHAEKIDNVCDSFEEAARSWDEKVAESEGEPAYINYTVPGVVTGMREMVAKKSGNKFGILTISHNNYDIECVVFADLWKKIKPRFAMYSVGIFELRQTPDNTYGPSYSLKDGTRLYER